MKIVTGSQFLMNKTPLLLSNPEHVNVIQVIWASGGKNKALLLSKNNYPGCGCTRIQQCQPRISFCVDKAHLRDLAKLKIAGNIGGDRCKSY